MVGIRVIVVSGVLGLARVVSDGLSVCDGGDEGGGLVDTTLVIILMLLVR